MVEIVNPLRNGIEIIEAFGFFNVVLPFILVYALVYGVLIKTDLFAFSKEGGQGQNVSNVIAMATAFFVVASTDVVNQLLGVIPQATFMLIVILFILMIFAMMGLENWFGNDSISNFYKVPIALAIIGVFLLMIDAGSPTGIPILRQINELLLGQGAFGLASAEAIGTLIGIALVVLVPIAVVYFLTKTN